MFGKIKTTAYSDEEIENILNRVAVKDKRIDFLDKHPPIVIAILIITGLPPLIALGLQANHIVSALLLGSPLITAYLFYRLLRSENTDEEVAS